MLTPTAQLITHASFFTDWCKFKTNLGNLKEVQEGILSRQLKDHPYLKNRQEFEKEEIKDYQQVMQSLANSQQKVVRQQPTSGTGEKEKLIPYTQSFIGELNKAINPWLFDMATNHPSILTGKHYWSISWLPTHWRKNGWHLDDFELLPEWKKNLTRTLLAVPHEISQAATLSSSQFATLAYLVSSSDLTFLSVWSPTFLIQLCELITHWQEPLKITLKTGQWAAFENELKFLKAPYSPNQAEKLNSLDFSTLWPALKLISSWDSSSSQVWARRLQKMFPHAAFQGKGLWATEGVVSIPFERKLLLSYHSHYYEFQELISGKLLAAHELKEGSVVHPILSCANGFTRYRMKDRIVVTGFQKSVPELLFLDRDDTFDMVGEKLDTHSLLQLHDLIKNEFPELSWVTAFAVNHKEKKPFYCFTFEGQIEDKMGLKNLISTFLHQHFHYHLAREIGQLGEEELFVANDGFKRYERLQSERGMVLGNIKVELASKVRNESEMLSFCKYFS